MPDQVPGVCPARVQVPEVELGLQTRWVALEVPTRRQEGKGQPLCESALANVQ